MEDTHIAIENLLPGGVHLYAVFDGHGGDEVALFLQKHVPAVMRELLVKDMQALGMTGIMFMCFKKIIEILPREMGIQVGSTAVIALCIGEHVVVGNCGDSRAIMAVGGQKSFAITEDHKPDGKSEYARIVAAGGKVTQVPGDVPRVNGQLAVSRSVGDFQLYPAVTWHPEISTFTCAWDKGVRLLLATDGVWDVMSNEEVATMDPTEVVLMARARGSADNITLLTVGA